MSNKIYITPGPSQTFPGLGQFMQDALTHDICAISHRSSAYKAIHQKTVENLAEIANLPSDFEVYFLGSATEAWERVFNNLVIDNSFHFVNGSFSDKFHEYGVASGVNSIKTEVDFGLGFDKVHQNLIQKNTELIALTHNETSSGVQTSPEYIHQVADAHKNSIIAVDMVSSFPYPELDYTKVDTALFSIQKCMGLPAGLGVWFANQKCRDKYQDKIDQGHLVGAHHTIGELSPKAKAFQTPSTPNILGIYLLQRVTDEILKKGVSTIRKETEEKYDLLCSGIQDVSFLDIAVKNDNHRSRTVVVANTNIAPNELNKHLSKYDLMVGAGYGSKKESQIRMANFPAIDFPTMEKLLKAFKDL